MQQLVKLRYLRCNPEQTLGQPTSTQVEVFPVETLPSMMPSVERGMHSTVMRMELRVLSSRCWPVSSPRMVTSVVNCTARSSSMVMVPTSSVTPSTSVPVHLFWDVRTPRPVTTMAQPLTTMVRVNSLQTSMAVPISIVTAIA